MVKKAKQPEFIPEYPKVLYDEYGREIPDPTPMEIPVEFLSRSKSTAEIFREMIRNERLQAELMQAGYETFEEADDFDIPDDPVDPSSPWENEFDPPIAEVTEAGRKYLEEQAKKNDGNPTAVKTPEETVADTTHASPRDEADQDPPPA